MYIKNVFITEKVGKPFKEVNTIEEAEEVASEISQGDIKNLIFKNSIIKSRFFSILEVNRPDITIINCNTSSRVFKDQIYGLKNIVYNNIDRCNDQDILKYVINDNKTIVC